MVACTPERTIAAQTNAPTSKYGLRRRTPRRLSSASSASPTATAASASGEKPCE